MAENNVSENLVMPTITEPNKNESLSTGAEHIDKPVVNTNIVSSRFSNDAFLTIPGLSSGTLVPGTSFNAVTPDQLSHFKPMLCVDNGFISTSRNSKEQSPVKLSSSSRGSSNQSWTDTANMPVLSIRCKNTSAELHKSRLGSGRRGKCIKYGSEWYTPSEFEALCGRASSKDWKRSIRFGGRSIQALIEEGILTPHATSCTCRLCCDDPTATGPIRLFVPYKRKKRNLEGEVETRNKKTKIEEPNIDNIHQSSNNSTSKVTWHSFSEDLETSNEYHILANNMSVPALKEIDAPNMRTIMKKINYVGNTLNKLSNELKICSEFIQVFNKSQMESLDYSPTELLTDSIVEDEIEQVPPSTEEVIVKKCENCNRAASAECSLCRKTLYCSTFCQKKDWPNHQIECLRNAESSAHQSIMLIVGNPQE